eukprot:CAMPEP_0184653582 /NCGR_PEP_ID=MMETSP0308-20130426/11307_1 /TAXON_ID=38269 /ORGANISM="Gloeochaete witrockiana, Strain SAG 46.84" /LENGTH=70 /DNA_ID=CAMNT_0027089127 /DNA_START=77 /DNA_END=289 /DNA_ORIENTATION=+
MENVAFLPVAPFYGTSILGVSKFSIEALQPKYKPKMRPKKKGYQRNRVAPPTPDWMKPENQPAIYTPVNE